MSKEELRLAFLKANYRARIGRSLIRENEVFTWSGKHKVFDNTGIAFDYFCIINGIK